MGELLSALFTGWQAEPVPLVLAAAGLLLYVAGARRRTSQGEPPPTRTQLWCLALGVGAVLLALVSPLDEVALQLQWAHMVQHLLLLLVGPPLIVLARPLSVGVAALPPAVRALPGLLGYLRRTARRRTWSAIAAVVLFVGVLWLWHVPALYNLTLGNQFVHDVEHTAFLAVGLIFWNLALPRELDGATLGMVGRSVLVLAGLVGSWLLAVYIGYAPTVLYEYHGLRGLSAASDQQLAAGVMWVPGSIPFVVVLAVLVARWFDADARAAATEMAGASGGRL